jgi:hypothetical protein
LGSPGGAERRRGQRRSGTKWEMSLEEEKPNGKARRTTWAFLFLYSYPLLLRFLKVLDIRSL